MNKKYKSPISWFGGKYYMANNIIEMFPEHKMYVEVFGGAGHILFKKNPSEIEVYNDIDSGLYEFFSVLRDEESAKRLSHVLQLTPYSREEFYYCRDNWMKQSDKIDRVRMWYVASMQSFSGNFSSWSHSKSKSRRGMSQCVSQWLGKIENNIPDAVERLRSVQIENMDYKDILKKYDNLDTLFYLDPPYVHDTRQMTYEYQHEMTNAMHKEMTSILLKIKGKCILSGYNTDIYDPLLNSGWKTVSIGEYTKRSEKSTSGNHRAIAEEVVWINFSQ